jgi:hypothetical protein
MISHMHWYQEAFTSLTKFTIPTELAGRLKTTWNDYHQGIVLWYSVINYGVAFIWKLGLWVTGSIVLP